MLYFHAAYIEWLDLVKTVTTAKISILESIFITHAYVPANSTLARSCQSVCLLSLGGIFVIANGMVNHNSRKLLCKSFNISCRHLPLCCPWCTISLLPLITPKPVLICCTLYSLKTNFISDVPTWCPGLPQDDKKETWVT